MPACLPACPPACLMPSDSRNSTMAKTTGLIFFAVQRHFSPRGAFCHTAVHAVHSSWTYHGPPLCPIHHEKCRLYVIASICYGNRP